MKEEEAARRREEKKNIMHIYEPTTVNQSKQTIDGVRWNSIRVSADFETQAAKTVNGAEQAAQPV